MRKHVRSLFPSCLTVLIVFAACSSAAHSDEPSSEQIYDANRIIEVSIELAANDWSELCKQSRDLQKTFNGSMEKPFTYFKGKVTVDGVTVSDVAIRKKGFVGSLDDHFPSLKVKFDEYVDQAPIRGLDTLTLNNNKQDSSLASQFLAYQLFNKSGVHAPRSNFARVTVNGEYLGVYTNVESVGKPFLKNSFGNKSGNLYEGTLADFYPKSVARFDSKTNTKQQDRAKMMRLAELLLEDDQLAISELEQIVDVENFLRFWAVESLINFWDGYTSNQNNFWIYESPENGKFYFIPWGADLAFTPPITFFGLGPKSSASVYSQSVLANRLYREKVIAERYRETMRWILANSWNEEELLKTTDRVEALLKEHLHKRQLNAPRAMKSLRQFIRTRRAVVEKELNGTWPVDVPKQPRKPMYTVEIGSATGSFKTVWSEKAPANALEGGDLTIAVQLDGNAVTFSDWGVIAHPTKPNKGPFGLGGPFQQREPTANMVIAVVAKPGEKPWTFTLAFDPEEFSSLVGKTLPIEGAFSRGKNGGNFLFHFNPEFVTGTVSFTRVGMNSGDEIEGTFDLKIHETHGVFINDREKKDRPAVSDVEAEPGDDSN